MNSIAAMPAAGFALERVYARSLHFEGVPESQVESAPELGEFNFGWDWSFVSPTAFDVTIIVNLEPARERPERVRASIAGIFQVTGDVPSVDLTRFAKLHAPAILMPFAREMIASLTGRGLFDALYIPPINMVAVMENMQGDSTTGVRQIKEGHPFARAFGFVEQAAPALHKISQEER